MRYLIIFLTVLVQSSLQAQHFTTPFERSGGLETATYAECIHFYKSLDHASPRLSIRDMGMSDAGYPYNLVLWSNDGHFDPAVWHRQHKLVMLIINGIHPGEPDGIDASMMLMRDLVEGHYHIPDNIALAVIPVYNIGGCLNRNSYSRVNQNGPSHYGFRGNSQNLDLNRDFTKCDSRDARSFAEIFHWLNPDVQLDNHVSDGADYQHTMTLISTQWNKLGGALGTFSHQVFDPALFGDMKKRGWPMCPYVNFEEGNLVGGWQQFYDPPRFSSGYAALFHCLSFISETHMLKPFDQRVRSTYALMQSLIAKSSDFASQILQKRAQDIGQDMLSDSLALGWTPDATRRDSIYFMGYEPGMRTSEVTGQPRLFYDHSKPFERNIPYADFYSPQKDIRIPRAYIIPQGWLEVIDLLKLNGVHMRRLNTDSVIRVEAYHIGHYQSSPRPYEKHHRNSGLEVTPAMVDVQFLKGDYLIDTHQPSRRFLTEMLEPTGDDSYFSWNFFDAILQQKEGYSDYRWEDLAAAWIKDHPECAAALARKKQEDTAFAKNAHAQLEFVYHSSPYWEPAFLRYPVYRLL